MSTPLDKGKLLGQVFTPKWIADLIVCWAIRNKEDKVLDPGAGTGVFIESAISRLRCLGSKKPGSQIVAIELDKKLANYLSSKYGKLGVKVLAGDFFLYKPPQGTMRMRSANNILPLFDAIIGNPPYVERQLIQNYKHLRKMFPDVPALSDIYVYFILHGSRFLKPNGRLGFIVSDSWLTTNYGIYLKKFLLERLKLRYVIYFDKRVFHNRLVSTTIILAEKSSKSIENIVFIRVKNLDSKTIDTLKEIICHDKKIKEFLEYNDHLVITKVPIRYISVSEQWLPYVLGLKHYIMLKAHNLFIPLERIAKVNIGLFTLANEFFIITEEKKKQFGIEDEFLRKIIVSSKELNKPIVDSQAITNYVLYCNKPKELLKGTNVLKYIEWGENQPVRIRGKNIVVRGYHNTPRIKKANRKPWYNLVPEIERRCVKPILLPRRIYDKFYVAWNRDYVVASDNFIVIEPKNEKFTFPLLAVLNSSITEYFIRVMCHLYGGGVCDLTPNIAKKIPVIDLTRLNQDLLEELEKSFKKFINSLDRTEIDKVIIRIIGLSNQEYRSILKELEEVKKVQKERR